MSSITTSIEQEWIALLRPAMLGTDRVGAPAVAIDWQPWAQAHDPAVQLLDRAAAVVAARRAGVMPNPALTPGPAAALDDRRRCRPDAVDTLAAMLRGEHEVLLPEWFSLCESGSWQIPLHLLPTLLQRARRDNALDAMVRRMAGDRAAWLIDAMPELGVRSDSPPPATAIPPPYTSISIGDSHAVHAAIVSAFADGGAHWAAAAQFRQAIAALHPEVLPLLRSGLERLNFNRATERTRIELMTLVAFRTTMLSAFTVQP